MIYEIKTPEKRTNDAEGNLCYRAMMKLFRFVGKDREVADLILAGLIRVVMMDVSCSQQKGGAGACRRASPGQSR